MELESNSASVFVLRAYIVAGQCFLKRESIENKRRYIPIGKPSSFTVMLNALPTYQEFCISGIRRGQSHAVGANIHIMRCQLITLQEIKYENRILCFMTVRCRSSSVMESTRRQMASRIFFSLIAFISQFHEINEKLFASMYLYILREVMKKHISPTSLIQYTI